MTAVTPTPRQPAPVSRLSRIGRALTLRCPACGQAILVKNWLGMVAHCPHCGLKTEREPGYYLGSIYINYGLTALTVTIAYFVLLFGFEVPSKWLTWGSLAFVVIFPLLFFPFARMLWLAFDLAWDPPEES
ncbi:MAG: DUF983 domain-containing protein [Pirellulales bacterium]|nr:DUF983 domain-containing protein [Pirellulales bacterium]